MSLDIKLAKHFENDQQVIDDKNDNYRAHNDQAININIAFFSIKADKILHSILYRRYQTLIQNSSYFKLKKKHKIVTKIIKQTNFTHRIRCKTYTNRKLRNPLTKQLAMIF